MNWPKFLLYYYMLMGVCAAWGLIAGFILALLGYIPLNWSAMGLCALAGAVTGLMVGFVGMTI